MAHTRNPPSMIFATEVGRHTPCSPQGYRPKHWELPLMLLVIILCTIKGKRLLVESEGFINLVCSFTIPKNTKVKPYATFCTAVPPSCFAIRALQENIYKRKQVVHLRQTSFLPCFLPQPHKSSPFTPSRCGHTAILLPSRSRALLP